MKLVDLFCGAGGFTLGAHLAGFETALAIDVDPLLSEPIKRNLPSVPLMVDDIGDLSDDFISSTVGRPDGIIGGPPCQGFSEIGRGAADDARNLLVDHFYRHVAAAQPRFFIMENVRGITQRHGRRLLDDALKRVEPHYDIAGPFLIHANLHGAPTSRPRIVVVGIHRTEKSAPRGSDFAGASRPGLNVRAAIADLKTARFVGMDSAGFDRWTYGLGRPSAYAAQSRSKGGALAKAFSGHRKVEHSSDVVKRFSLVPQGKLDAIGRHPRLHLDGLSPTLRAGTGADRGSYQSVRPLHPEEDRVITPREAARLQGFPDWYDFHPTSWHSFRMIGNSVCPPVSSSLLTIVSRILRIKANAELTDAA